MYEEILKKHLYEIIDNLDEEYELRKKFKLFNLKFSDKIMKSYSGIYYPSDRTIILPVTLEHNNANQVCTALHELAHHCDSMVRGITNHDKNFYAMFAKLLYSALDLGKVQYEDALKIVHVNSDYSKVIKMLRNYTPSLPANKVENEYVNVIVSNVDKNDFKLRLYGYSFNERGKYWFKKMTPNVVEMEADLLAGLNYIYKVVDANMITVLDDEKKKVEDADRIDEAVSKAIKEWDYLDEQIKKRAVQGHNLENIRESLDGKEIHKEADEEWFIYNYITISGKVRNKISAQGHYIYLDPFVDIAVYHEGLCVSSIRDVNIKKLKEDYNGITKLKM